jgi:hypothetical protein
MIWSEDADADATANKTPMASQQQCIRFVDVLVDEVYSNETQEGIFHFIVGGGAC